MPQLLDPKCSQSPEKSVAKCLYCGASKATLWLRKVQDRLQYVSGEWDFYRCDECGSAMLHPMPTAEDLASLYPPIYTFAPELGARSRFSRLLAFLEYHLFFRPTYRTQARIVSNYVRKHGIGKRLLDIGCGRGLRLLEFRREGFEVHGCDFSEESVSYLRDCHHISADVADVSTLNTVYEANSFDIVTAFYVIEHVVDVEEVFRSCLRLLKPGGVIVAVCPLSDSTQAKLFGNRWVVATEAPRHTNIPSQIGFIGACRDVGFEDITISADSTVANAACVGMSVFPNSSTTSVYGAGQWRVMVNRLLGAALTYAVIPWALLDKWVFKRPAMGMLFARKPV
ncbi:MAG: class I SAM-dependent methyltransferase [Planctomycetota bacterium]|nr:MAG: class I SAM-dependent methyltransferase [Planctomycetota bacterium]